MESELSKEVHNNPEWNPIQKLAVEINRGSKKTLTPTEAGLLLTGMAIAVGTVENTIGTQTAAILGSKAAIVGMGIGQWSMEKGVPISDTLGPMISRNLWELGCTIAERQKK